MRTVELLDCTLRDGGWAIGFSFGDRMMQRTVESLVLAGIDWIELGYLDREAGSRPGKSMYNDAEAVSRNGSAWFPGPDDCRSHGKRLVMIDFGHFPPEELPPAGESGLDAVRLCFHKKDAGEAVRSGREILRKGYRLFLQPMANSAYTDREFRMLAEKAAADLPGLFAFYVVDSFGCMRPEEVTGRLYLADTILPEGIRLGLHTHNSLGLSFRNAEEAVRLPLNRDFILDASLDGIGKGAGNLDLGRAAALLNAAGSPRYRMECIAGAEAEVRELRKAQPRVPAEVWALAAEYRISATYAARFWEKGITVQELEELMKAVPEDRRHAFDRDTAERLLGTLFRRPGRGGRSTSGSGTGEE